MENFSDAELKILSSLDSPRKIQDFLDKMEYNIEKDGDTYFSPRLVLKNRTANCIEAALFAAAALRVHGRRAMIMDLNTGKERDADHVLAVFKVNGHWGAIAKSKYPGLSFREPIHRTIRELVLTYFEDYFNYYGRKTLRGYSDPIDMSRFDKIEWMTTGHKLTCVEDHLNKVRHNKLLTKTMTKNLRKVSPMMKESGELWIKKNRLEGKIKDESQ